MKHQTGIIKALAGFKVLYVLAEASATFELKQKICFHYATLIKKTKDASKYNRK